MLSCSLKFSYCPLYPPKNKNNFHKIGSHQNSGIKKYHKSYSVFAIYRNL
nr:MAG TPA: hypothetical protein [Caudoviricetes sp.]